MPSGRELKNRITSVKNTKKITSAMYMISSAKLRKAKEGLAKTRPYFYNTEHEIKRIFQSMSREESHYFYPAEGRKEGETYIYLVITADKGLAGAYNHNVIKAAEAEMRKHKNVRLFVVGEYGRRYFTKHQYPIEEGFFYPAVEPTFRQAREISSHLLEEYNNGRADEIRVIYSDMENELTSSVRRVRLLPFERKAFLTPDEIENSTDTYYKFVPSPRAVLDQLIPTYVAGFIYGALVDSFSAEQNARMNAMSAANSNAEELLGHLQIEYNRVRQAAITQEITEVAAGAKALKRKKKKKLEEMQLA